MVQRPEFGNPEHIAISKTRAKYLFFPTERGPFRMRIWSMSASFDEGEAYLNGAATFYLAKELGFGNMNIEISFLATLNPGQGRVGFGRFEKDEVEEGIENFRVSMGWGVMKEYKRFGFRQGLVYSINHVFFHEIHHIREEVLGIPNLEYEFNWDDNSPPEVFAREKIDEVISGRKYLLPLVVV